MIRRSRISSAVLTSPAEVPVSAVICESMIRFEEIKMTHSEKQSVAAVDATKIVSRSVLVTCSSSMVSSDSPPSEATAEPATPPMPLNLELETDWICCLLDPGAPTQSECENQAWMCVPFCA